MSAHTVDFELDVLAHALQDSEFLRKAAPVLDSHHFSEPEYGWVWGAVTDYWTRFAERPGPKVLGSRADREFARDPTKLALHVQIVVDLFRRKVTAPQSSLDELRQFVRGHNWHVAMEEALDSRDKGDIDEAFARVRKLVVEDVAETGTTAVNWLDSFEDRQRTQKHRKEHPDEYPVVPTGLPTLDGILGGGTRPGELSLVVGTTGRGKSIFLTHLGYSAITDKQHPCNVLHATLEMSVEQVAMRYDSRFTGLAHGKFKGFDFTPGELADVSAKVDRNRARLAPRLRIVTMPLTTCDIAALRGAVTEARAAMPRIDLLVVDSADHMRGTGRQESKRLEQAQIYWDLKALAVDENLSVWSSVQAGREWEKRVATAEAVSESYDKSRIADLVVTLNDPDVRRRGVVQDSGDDGEDELREPETAGDLSLFVAKYRDGPSKETIRLRAEFERMLITEAVGGP